MEKKLKLVQIKTEYINYLRSFDEKVCFNKEWSNSRPYVGVLFQLKKCKYFAPLTSSGKGVKLKDCPKAENVTFFPIDKCKYGGVNLNNMIPVVDDVYSEINLHLGKHLSEEKAKYRVLMINQIEFLNKNEKHLREKANMLYNMKLLGQLYENYDNITCDFKKLEKVSREYNKG